MTTVLWVNGQLVDPNEPAVSGLDRGLLLGYGVFETLAVENGVPFALTRHLRRLESSARKIKLKLPALEDIRAGLDAALGEWNTAVGPQTRGRLRLTITGGVSPLGASADPARPTVLIAIAPAGPVRKLGSKTGARALLSPWRVNPHSALAGAKTLSYAAHAVLQQYARENNVDELISATVDGHLCEGATSNVFVESGGELLTPPLEVGCLPGITRELILQWGAESGLPVRAAQAGELPISILDDAPHLAITGSVRGIMPLTQIGSRELEPGPLTEEVAAIFQQKSALEVDP